MAVSEQRLNGARDYRARIDVWYSGVRNVDNNDSRFDWRVELIDAARWGSWTNDRCEVWVSIGGTQYYNTFTIPSSTAGQNRVVISGETWHKHDGEGYRPAFACDAYIKVPHSNIGEGGSGQAWVDAPRIPQIPGKPGNGWVSEVRTDNLRLNGSPPDDRGAGIEEYQFSAIDTTGQTGQRFISHNGSVLDIGGLVAGRTYILQYRARNWRGWGPWSDGISARTRTALYFIPPEGGAPESVELLLWNGSSYQSVELLIDPDKTGNFVAPAG